MFLHSPQLGIAHPPGATKRRTGPVDAHLLAPKDTSEGKIYHTAQNALPGTGMSVISVPCRPYMLASSVYTGISGISAQPRDSNRTRDEARGPCALAVAAEGLDYAIDADGSEQISCKANKPCSLRLHTQSKYRSNATTL